MKRIITLFVLLTSTLFYAQSSGITYQAVLYNPIGEILPGNNNTNAVLSNKDICLRFSITDAQTSLEYQETQKVKTDEFGMVNLLVGSGSQIGGYATNFSAIVWSSSAKKLQVAIDVTGTCSNFIEVSDQNFSAVPFAYASKTAENVTGIVAIANGGTGANTVSGAKTNLGLNNVDNTSDANKPISTATQTALNTKENIIAAGTTSQYFRGDKTWQTLDKTVVGLSNVDNTSDANKPISTATQTALNTKENTIAAGTTSQYFRGDKTWQTLDKTVVGLSNVDNTSDANKPVSTATQTELNTKENTIATGTTAQYYRGDKTWQTLDKTVVGLSNVDNTSDANKPISTATQAALDTKEAAANKSTVTTLGNSDVLFPTQNAVKTYVDNQISTGVVDASTTVKGKIQLAGDLEGTAAAPLIKTAAITVAKLADDAVETTKIKNGSVITDKIADNAVTNAKIGQIVSVNKGGTGSNMSNAGAGYVKQATNGANFTTVSSIPVAHVDGAVSSVNGVTPVNGNVAVILGRVFTGTTLDPEEATSIMAANPARKESDIYIITQTGNVNNGRTFIFDGTNWIEVSTDLSTTDARYVNVAGDSMEGNLTVPTGKKLIIADLPTNPTDAANKDYVDTKIGGSGTTNFVPKFSAAKTLADSSIFDNGKVGIGTTSPANKLEITQGTAGNSGLRFTNLNSSSTATTSTSKVLGLNSTGDVILTNIPGTQNIVDFSTATPTTSGVVFTPNTPTDQSVIFQSAIDNSMWTYNGSTYVSYAAPASTAWNLANTTNDAGKNKTSAIWRGGNVGIGINNPITTLHVNNALPATNTVNADAQVLQLSRPNNPGVKWPNIAQFNLGSYSSTANLPYSRLDLALNDFGTYTPSNVMTWQANGNVGIGTTAPTSLLHLVTPSTARMLFETTDGAAGQASIDLKAGNTQYWRLIGQGSANGGRFDFWNNTLNSSALSISSTNNVGIGTQSPTAQFEVATTNGLSAIIRRGGTAFQTPANLILQKTSGANAGIHGVVAGGDFVGRILFSASNGGSYLTNGTDIVGYTAGAQSASNNGGGIFFRTVPQNSVANSIERLRIDHNGNIGIGTSAPSAQLHTTGSVRFAGAGTPSAGKVLTSDASGNATWQPVNAATTVANQTANFTLTAADSGSVIVVNSATTVTVTVPSTFSVGFYCQIIQSGAGQVNVVGSGGITISSALGTHSRTMGSSIGIMVTNSTNAFLSGDTAF